MLKIKTITLISLILPWPVRRWMLQKFCHYQIHPTSRIGYAWVYPKKLIMEKCSEIGHFTVCKGMSLLQLGEHSTIGKGNWITGFPADSSVHFTHQNERFPELIIGDHSKITHRHLIDCTNSIIIGKFSTIAGYRSQILTHSIDLEYCRQSSASVKIGDYCFVGTNSVILGGSILPDSSVLGAMSLLNKQYSKNHTLYGGTPAKPIQTLEEDFKYFFRKVGSVA